MVVIIAAYSFLFQWLEFIISTALIIVFVGRLFSESWAKCAIGGVVMGILFFLLFDNVLDVVLPAGLLGGLV